MCRSWPAGTPNPWCRAGVAAPPLGDVSPTEPLSPIIITAGPRRAGRGAVICSVPAHLPHDVAILLTVPHQAGAGVVPTGSARETAWGP